MLSNIIFLAASAALARAHGIIWGAGTYCASVRGRRREAQQTLTAEQEDNPNAEYPAKQMSYHIGYPLNLRLWVQFWCTFPILLPYLRSH